MPKEIPPPLRCKARSGSLGRRFDLDAVDQQNIDNLEGIVAFLHDHAASALGDGHKIGVRHLDRAPISQVQNKWLKRFVTQNLANRDSIHAASLKRERLAVKRSLRA